MCIKVPEDASILIGQVSKPVVSMALQLFILATFETQAPTIKEKMLLQYDLLLNVLQLFSSFLQVFLAEQVTKKS